MNSNCEGWPDYEWDIVKERGGKWSVIDPMTGKALFTGSKAECQEYWQQVGDI